MQGKEKALLSQNKTRQLKRQSKDSYKVAQLKKYVASLKKHPPVREHYAIAKSFSVLNYRFIFRQDAIRRFINATHFEPTTAATIEKLTGIKHKYICQLKSQLEKSNLIKVVGTGNCGTTGSSNVQYLSSNPEHWEKEFSTNYNQLTLF